MKWEKFLDTLQEVEANNGDFGYFCTVGEMLDNERGFCWFRFLNISGGFLRRFP